LERRNGILGLQFEDLDFKTWILDLVQDFALRISIENAGRKRGNKQRSSDGEWFKNGDVVMHIVSPEGTEDQKV
jgi:hypothetical protein